MRRVAVYFNLLCRYIRSSYTSFWPRTMPREPNPFEQGFCPRASRIPTLRFDIDVGKHNFSSTKLATMSDDSATPRECPKFWDETKKRVVGGVVSTSPYQ
jgi:hypothetical protein